MTAATMSFDVEERRNGWVFRFPSDDETALWRGPYPNRKTAEEAAIKAIEEHLAQSVLDAFGLT
jgi:hypothetical protein